MKYQSKDAAKPFAVEGFPAAPFSLLDHNPLDLNTGSSSDHVREISTSLHFRSASISRQDPGATGDAFLSAKARMKDSPIGTSGLPGDFGSPDDDGLFIFINTLRLSVKAKVAEEQERGLSLSEIVVQVRELVRLAEQDIHESKHFPSHAFRAISRQAIAWCVESYRPIVITAGIDLSAPSSELAARSLPPVSVPVLPFAGRLPAQSPNSRGLP